MVHTFLLIYLIIMIYLNYISISILTYIHIYLFIYIHAYPYNKATVFIEAACTAFHSASAIFPQLFSRSFIASHVRAKGQQASCRNQSLADASVLLGARGVRKKCNT